MAVERAVIGWPVHTSAATFTGGSWESSYPVTNAGALPLAKVARSADAELASTQLVATFPAQRAVRALALVRHSISLAGLVRIRLYSDAGLATNIYDSGWVDVWPVVYPSETLEWESDNWWTGKYTATEIAGYVWTRPFWLSQAYMTRAVKIEIDDTTNAAGYVDLGYLLLAQGFQLSINPEWGAKYGFEFNTESQRALGGAEYFDRRPKARVFQGVVPHMPRDDALARHFELARQADLDQPFLWFPHPAETIHWLRTVFLARNDDPGLFAIASRGRDEVPISVKEVL